MDRTPQRRLRWTLIGAALWMAGCANLTSFAPGTPAAEIEAARGKPYRIWPEPNGASSWEYPAGPAGRYTYMVHVGADGRITRVDQVLDWPFFRRLESGMPIQEVEHTLGRPVSKTYMPLQNENVWAWRWVETVWYRCFYAHFAPDGRLARTSVRDEEVGDHGIVSTPC